MLNEVSTTVSVIAERVRTASAPGRRTDAHRVALAVEGGSSRGAYAGGMLLGLEELGLVSAFDAVYGSSAGALGAAWLLAGDVRTGLGIWTDPG